VRVALDTNILAYAEGVNGVERRTVAMRLLADLAEDEIVIPAQALAELFTVLTRKPRRSASEARPAVLGWHAAYQIVDTSSGILVEAMELATSHQFGLWDALMLASAAGSGCRMLFSEDMQNSFTWRNVAIRNPFLGLSVSET
jgi:predicted nucleic acid-binding protein